MTKPTSKDTAVTHVGRDPQAQHGVVNPPVYHASTIIYPTVAAMERQTASYEAKYRYGRIGTPTSRALEEAIIALEGGHGAITAPSGLAAVTTALLAFVKAGDHLLIADSAYAPTRSFADHLLRRLGVEVEYYDPLVGAGIAGLLKANTRVVFLESPGSQTFEVQDVPAITAVARARGVLTMIDSTWATPLLSQPIGLGVDLVIHSATKYIVGHADASVGLVVAADERSYKPLKTTAVQLGQCAGPDDIYLALRGLRTLGVRLRQHQDSALQVARWLQQRPEVARLLYPALPDDPGHALWRRDFSGASGLFAAILRPASKAAVAAMLDGMALFAIGASWGGFESLILPQHPHRTARPWAEDGPLIRLHVGLEDPADLIADLEAGFERLNRAVAAAA